MSKFIEEMKKVGKIRPASDAFENYPVHLEDHKGDINYFITEEDKDYGKFNVGDIVFVKDYKYEDGSSGQNHLFVIIDDENSCASLEYFGLIISSNINKLKYESNVYLEKDNINNLHKDSIVKTDVIYVLYEKDILFKIGEVPLKNIELYKERIKCLV